jgi:uncharacterized protein YbjT (DUF2867 family)
VATTTNETRRAALAGASGLVGRALLARLLDSPRYGRVLVLLRRPVPDLPAHRKLTASIVDFCALPPLPPVDDVFVAIGTTIKAAGSQAAFRRVDLDAVLDVAQAGRAAGAKRLLVVSAFGADPASPVFYLRVKGEMERAVVALGYDHVVIARPSLLIGERAALGQPARAGEQWAQRLLQPLAGWVPERLRPIRADAVAASMLRAALAAEAGTRILASADMQRPVRA